MTNLNTTTVTAKYDAEQGEGDMGELLLVEMGQLLGACEYQYRGNFDVAVRLAEMRSQYEALLADLNIQNAANLPAGIALVLDGDLDLDDALF